MKKFVIEIGKKDGAPLYLQQLMYTPHVGDALVGDGDKTAKLAAMLREAGIAHGVVEVQTAVVVSKAPKLPSIDLDDGIQTAELDGTLSPGMPLSEIDTEVTNPLDLEPAMEAGEPAAECGEHED